MANGNKDIDIFLLLPLFITLVILVGIAAQFKDSTAVAYTLLAIITFVFYAIAHQKGFAGWIGLGSRKDLWRNMGLGVLIFLGIVFGGGFIGIPLAIGTSFALAIFYRWWSAFTIEEPLFRGIIQPTFEKYFGNAFSASIVTSIAWATFHIVALQGNPGQIVGLVIIGVVFSMANNYGKSLVPSLVAHGLWNLKAVVLT
jgi:membrane protease YdiL (CAAX protease family)